MFSRCPGTLVLHPGTQGPRTRPHAHAPANLSLCPAEPGDHVDAETARAGARGFSGCLSALQFQRVAPLKAALLPGRSGRASVRGPVARSSCGAGEDAARERTHARAGGHCGPRQEPRAGGSGERPEARGDAGGS